MNSFTINSDAEGTTNNNVTLNQTCDEATSEMRYTLYTWNGSSWSYDGAVNWTNYTANYSQTLHPAEQRKLVYIYSRDRAGNLSSPNYLSDTIYFDKTIPSAASVSSITYSGTDYYYVKGTQTITATGTDSIGIKKIEFYIGGAKRGEDTTSPYTFSWDTTGYSDSSYSIYSRVVD